MADDLTENEILDGLTDEERAIFESDSEDHGAIERQDTLLSTEIPGGDDAAHDAGDDGDDGNGGAADASGDGKDAGAAGRDDGGAVDDGAGQAVSEQPQGQAGQSAPILVAQAPADADAKLQEIGGKKSEILTQFEDGDITAKEYQQQLDTLMKEERQIERAVEKAQLAAEMEQQRLKNEWDTTVSSFLSANKVYNPESNSRLYRMLDQEVKDVAGSAEAAKWTGAQILAKAHQNLVDAGLAPAAKKPAQQKNQKADLPPSLHNVPAAELSDTSDGKYAALERLANTNPLAYEEALMKLSDAERDAYLAS